LTRVPPRTSLLLIVNPAAQGVTARRVNAVIETLDAPYRVEVEHTKERGHAQEIAARARLDGFEVLAVLGGDGTLNEAINGVAGTSLPVTVLPAGGANVFARSLGLPRDALEAARRLAEGTASTRRVSLGKSDGRWFSANFGVGFDAAIVRHVEARPRIKRLIGDSYFVWAGLRVFFAAYDRRSPRICLTWSPDASAVPAVPAPLFMVVAQNLDPYTFLGRRPLRLCPDAAIEDGVDVFGLDSMRLRIVLPVLFSAFGRARHGSSPHVILARRQTAFSVRCDQPLPVQMDGEYLGERSNLLVESIPDALTVLV
jgi:diacylglycerol kinase family enzyme